MTGYVLHYFKTTCTQTILKNLVLPKSYCPPFHSWFPFLLEQLLSVLESINIFERSQSGFRENHSTETVTNDLLMNAAAGMCSVLVLLDMSAAFDMIDHRILLDRMSGCSRHSSGSHCIFLIESLAS